MALDNTAVLDTFYNDLNGRERELLSSSIVAVTFHRVTKRILVCVVETDTGFESHGISKVRDPKHFERYIGELYALKHALKYVETLGNNIDVRA